MQNILYPSLACHMGASTFLQGGSALLGGPALPWSSAQALAEVLAGWAQRTG